jgi:hypothetical protein
MSAAAFAPGHLKNQLTAGASTTTATQLQAASPSAASPASGPLNQHTAVSAAAGGTAAAGPSTSAGTGAVLGATGAANTHATSGGVLGATAAVAQGTLPFTGMQVWIVAAIGLLILGAGVATRRLTRPAGSGS